jgi:hypothetical protein
LPRSWQSNPDAQCNHRPGPGVPLHSRADHHRGTRSGICPLLQPPVAVRIPRWKPCPPHRPRQGEHRGSIDGKVQKQGRTFPRPSDMHNPPPPTTPDPSPGPASVPTAAALAGPRSQEATDNHRPKVPPHQVPPCQGPAAPPLPEPRRDQRRLPLPRRTTKLALDTSASALAPPARLPRLLPGGGPGGLDARARPRPGRAPRAA